jgi:hypothetical protein
VITVLADSPLKTHFYLIFWRSFTHFHRLNPLCAGRWKCVQEKKSIQVAENHERLAYQKAAGIYLAAYAAHAREVRLPQGEIGPLAETGVSGAAELGGSDNNDIE